MPEPRPQTLIGLPFYELPTVDSTNNYARTLIHEGLAQHGTTVFAHEQQQGKGQRGKSWITEKDSNILLSIVIRPSNLHLTDQFALLMCLANAARQLIGRYVPHDVSVKWPNDIYWQDRKAAGILVETIIRGSSWEYGICGVGINVNQGSFPAFLPNPVSILQITGKKNDPLQMAKELCDLLQQQFLKLENSISIVREEYLHHLYKKGQQVTFKKNGYLFEAVVKSVTHEGKLLLIHEKEEEFDFGELQWVV